MLHVLFRIDVKALLNMAAADAETRKRLDEEVQKVVNELDDNLAEYVVVYAGDFVEFCIERKGDND